MTYQDQKVLTLCGILWSVTAALVIFIILPLKVVSQILYFKRVAIPLNRLFFMILYPLGIVLCFLLGLTILFLFDSTTFGRWYIASPLLFSFWTICFLILNRNTTWPMHEIEQIIPREEKEQTVEEEIKEMEQIHYIHNPDTETDHSVDIIDEHFEQISNHEHKVRNSLEVQKKAKTCPLWTKELFSNIIRGVAKRKLLTTVIIVAIALFSVLISLTACYPCLAHGQSSLTTSFTRIVFGQGHICGMLQLLYAHFSSLEYHLFYLSHSITRYQHFDDC
jgi:hypothetical protein